MNLSAAQRQHWQDTYQAHPHMYGFAPSAPGVYAARAFKAAGAERVLELAAGHGRDALYFAKQGFTVLTSDFSSVAVAQIRRDARSADLEPRIQAFVHDIREPLLLSRSSVDAVYAHMALCMALSTSEIHRIVDEIHSVLRPNGMFVFTVRHSGDAHYRAGNSHGDDIFESGGFAVHFFTRQLLDDLANGWVCDEVHAFEEGELPRRLWRVTFRKDGSKL
ncbi:class I SAM-dependent methyltransferase [Mycobacterium montefiorense]|uniref:Methyltransferase domain-containing protein n=1 Tax=Mycobacterium montefiorense TaxID=154654 RepID=A0AA37UX19_9MYCO|nr:class I SAM-dependent methyltransferase [Mycobacterium montefiorense]GBG39425.1 hypothetical protein MmonteBS_37970 [Mycobacterium montefiorense]GKU33198.1 hypothetical protein NJB14191_05450 [Mycobacterium montefiorense]GKU42233.1 hypothetical protein NJB14192_42160 [Mycobacterium montefiorense]GKU44165.1 hypothetical protein NJB14194_07940 [Mycobacterium montefiorense]GKU53158.1 hypothetical protein NJB14195_43990 [Mycobacterium montefiorense]